MLGLAVVVTLTFSIGVLVAGPIYAQGGREAILSSALETAAVNIVNARYLAAAPPGFGLDSADEVVTREIRNLPIGATIVRQGKAAASLAGNEVRALFREGAEDHLPNFDGTVPGPGEVALPRELASALKVEIGDVVNGPVPLVVSAVFDFPDPADPYWFGERSPFPPAASPGVGVPRIVDNPPPVLLSREGFLDLVTEGGTSAEYAWDVFLDLQGESLQTVQTLPPALLSAAGKMQLHPDLSRIQLQTGLETLLGIVRTRVSHLWLPILLVVLLIGAVTVAVLAGVGALTLSRQGFELAVLHSRGFSKGKLLAAQGLQAGLSAALAYPLGLAFGLFLARLAAASNGPSLAGSFFPITLNPVALAMGAVTAVIGAGVLTLLSLPIVARTVLDERRALSREDRPLAARVPVELFVAPVGIFAFVQLRVEETPSADAIDPLLLLAPTLLIFAASFFALRVALLALRKSERVVGRSRAVPRYLALRRLGRSPGVAYAAGVLLVMSMGLLVVASAYRSTALRSNFEAARQNIGSDKRVQAAWTTEQLDAFDNIPPGMTPVFRSEPILGTPGLSTVPQALGVDPATYASGGWWRRDYSARSLEELLGELQTETTGLTIPEDAGTVTVSLEAPKWARKLGLGATFLDADNTPVTAAPQPVRPGQVTYRFEAPPGSRLLSITLSQEGFELLPEEDKFVIGVSVGDAELDLGSWQPITWRQSGGELSPDGTFVLHPGVGKVVGGIQPAYAPIPAVVSGEVGVTQGEDFTASFSGLQVPLRRIATAQAWPSVFPNRPFLVLPAPTLMELALAIPEGSIALNEVWATGADPTVELTRAGWTVGSVASAEPIEAALSQLPRSLAIGMYAAAAMAGLALVVIGVTMALSFQQRRRDYEFAALRAMGTTPRQVRRTLVLEQVLLVGFAVLVGVGIGYAMLRLTMPYVGRSLASPVPAPELVVDSKLLLASILAIAVASATGVWVASRALLRSSVTAVLRSEAE